MRVRRGAECARRPRTRLIHRVRYEAEAVRAHGLRGVRYLPDATEPAAYGLAFSRATMSRMAFWARTLLPASSSGGEMTAMPNLPGATAMMPPPTPLLAGSPV